MIWNVVDNVGDHTGVSLSQYNGIVENLDNLYDGNENYLPTGVGMLTAIAAIRTSTTSWVALADFLTQVNIDLTAHVIITWTVPIIFNGGTYVEFQVYVDGETITGDVASHTFIGHTTGLNQGMSFTYFIPNLSAGLHTIQLAWKHTGANAATMRTDQYYSFQAFAVRA